jgi:ferritin
MDEMSQDIMNLLLALLQGEDGANYFYQAARVWARSVGYPGAERKFACYAKKHKHHAKCLQNIFADWGGKITWPGIKPPSTYFLLLPDVVTDAAKVENDLMVVYDNSSRKIMDLSLGVFDEVNKLRKCATDSAQEFAELVDKLKLIDEKNGLALVYFDRKILRWPARD